MLQKTEGNAEYLIRMLKEEALWIARILEREHLPAGSCILDMGSCTEEYRKFAQPFIDEIVFKPLRDRGCKIIHADANAGNGVDWVFDFSRQAASEGLLKPYLGCCNAVLCASLLEHVENRGLVLEYLEKLSAPQGLIILTVPNRFRYHAHPIDTGYRPSVEELEKLFEENGFLKVASSLIEVEAEPEHVPLQRGQRLYNKLLRCLHQWLRINLPFIQPVEIRNRVAAIVVRRL